MKFQMWFKLIQILIFPFKLLILFYSLLLELCWSLRVRQSKLKMHKMGTFTELPLLAVSNRATWLWAVTRRVFSLDISSAKEAFSLVHWFFLAWYSWTCFSILAMVFFSSFDYSYTSASLLMVHLRCSAVSSSDCMRQQPSEAKTTFLMAQYQKQ